jgi:hypothetical protein
VVTMNTSAAPNPTELAAKIAFVEAMIRTFRVRVGATRMPPPRTAPPVNLMRKTTRSCVDSSEGESPPT